MDTQVIELIPSDPDLVTQFKLLLKNTGIEIKDYSLPAKYFQANKNDSRVFMLAHESTKHRWWGVLCNLIKHVRQEKHVKSGLIRWGIVLLDGYPLKGYWILAENLDELKRLGGATERDLQFHFHGRYHRLTSSTRTAICLDSEVSQINRSRVRN